MNIEFHYYITKYLAVMSGFESDEASLIAYASQYVDDNSTRYSIEKPDGSIYENYISQTCDITKPQLTLMRVYLLFHFLPGDPNSNKARRRDGKMHALMTTPASHHAQGIFFEATKTENLYLLGIASHMLADSISHQNFVGTFDEVNAMKGLWQTLTPNIGHADAGFKPDIPNLVWEDPRLIQEFSLIDNKDRVILASQKLYANYLMITSNPNRWSAVKDTLIKIIGDPLQEKDIKKYKEQKEIRIGKLRAALSAVDADEEYDPRSWFHKAVDVDVKLFNDEKFKYDPIKDKLKFKEKYEFSDWFRFQQAVKEYQRTASIKLGPILTQLEIKEW
jgi:Family of unknown function (DUF6765)